MRQPIAGQAALDGADYRHAAGDRRLEPELTALGGGQREEGDPSMGDDLLVRGHDRDAASQRLADPCFGRIEPADQLDEHVGLEVERLLERVGPDHAIVEPAGALDRGAAIHDGDQLNVGAQPAKHLRHGAPHRAVPGEHDPAAPARGRPA